MCSVGKVVLDGAVGGESEISGISSGLVDVFSDVGVS